MNHRRWSMGTAAILGALLAAACADRPPVDATADAGDPVRGGTAVYCTVNLPDRLVSFVSNDRFAADLRPVLFTPLVLYDTAGGVRPHLATEWSWDDDRRRLALTLRDDVAWHDGTPVTAEDVAWSATIAADSTWGYLGRGDLRALRDVTVRDARTVELTFDEPYVADMEPFTRLPILPRHLLDTVAAASFATHRFHREPVGSGPFRFVARTPDGAIQLERAPQYPEGLGAPYLDRIVLRQLPEIATEVVELQTGGVDLCIGGSTIGKEVAGVAGISTLPVPPVGVQSIVLDTRQPPFDDARVRRALSAALKREEIAAVVSPHVRPAGSFLPDGARRWRLVASQPDADSALAAALLDSAGWRRADAGGTRANGGRPLRFTIVAPRTLEPALTVAQAQLARVGADAQLRFMETASFISTIMSPETRPQAMGLGFIPDQVLLPDPWGELHSGGAQNLASYRNPGADSLLDRLRTVLPDAERASAYEELQRRIADDVPMIYTYHFPRVLAVGPRMRGVAADLNGPFSTVSSWWVAEGRRGPAPADSAPAATTTAR